MSIDCLKIAVIGAGQIGIRHLQALLQLERPAVIQVMDPSPYALRQAKRFVFELSRSKWVRDIHFVFNLSELSDEIDCAVIATTADVRRAVIEKLLLRKKVKYLLLEKVLFQKIEDYYDVKSLLKKYEVSAWVNCSRRVWPSYHKIKKELTQVNHIECVVSGSQWGLACNSIHFVDLMAFLTDEREIGGYVNHLFPHIQPSKRSGFVEFNGTLQCRTRDGSILTMTSYKDGTAPLLIQLNSHQTRIIISEWEGKMWRASESSGWKWVEESFSVVYQSQLTHLIVNELIDTGQCDLPTYDESVALHVPLISAFLSHYSDVIKKRVDACPIT